MKNQNNRGITENEGNMIFDSTFRAMIERLLRNSIRKGAHPFFMSSVVVISDYITESFLLAVKNGKKKEAEYGLAGILIDHMKIYMDKNKGIREIKNSSVDRKGNGTDGIDEYNAGLVSPYDTSTIGERLSGLDYTSVPWPTIFRDRIREAIGTGYFKTIDNLETHPDFTEEYRTERDKTLKEFYDWSDNFFEWCKSGGSMGECPGRNNSVVYTTEFEDSLPANNYSKHKELLALIEEYQSHQDINPNDGIA